MMMPTYVFLKYYLLTNYWNDPELGLAAQEEIELLEKRSEKLRRSLLVAMLPEKLILERIPS